MFNFRIFIVSLFSLLFFCNLSVKADDIAAADVAGERSPALSSNTDGRYFTIRPDLRKCISPICGGWWVRAVNRKVMRCVDGSVSRECYVGADRINIPNLSLSQIAQLRDAMSTSKALLQANMLDVIPYGILVINAAWIAATDQAPKGVFINARDNGVRCITYPCPSYDAEILNRKLMKVLAGVDLEAVGASQEQLELAFRALVSSDGLPMAGRFTEVTGPGGTLQGFAASQFFLPVKSEAVAFCRPTGCSGQICADTDVITTCEWRPEYACYRTAQCSRQSNGDCGWVMDEELRRCLAEAAGNSLLQVQ